MMLPCLSFLVLLLDASAAEPPNTTGKEFILVFIEHVINSSKLELYLTTSEVFPVEARISVPRASQIQSDLSVKVVQGEVTSVTVESVLNLQFTNMFPYGISVRSDGNISVQGFSTSYDTAYNSVGAFLVYPVTTFDQEYILITHCEINSCQFAVVSATDGTKIDISFKISGSNTVTVDGINYYNRDTLTIHLNKYEAFQVQTQGDLSGTRVTSSHPVGVFVGADYTTVGGGSGGDSIVEQVLPHYVWGMDYVLVSVPTNSSHDIIKVVAEFQDTRFTFLGTDHVINEDGGALTLKLPPDSVAILTSNKRILVAQLTSTPDVNDAGTTDASMLLVAPKEQWLNKYIFCAPRVMSPTYAVSLAIFTETQCQNLVLLDGTQLTLTWTAVTSEVSVAHLKISNGSHTLTLGDACSSMWGYLYGRSDQQAWTMPIGSNIKKLPEAKPSTSSLARTTGPSTASHELTPFTTSTAFGVSLVTGSSIPGRASIFSSDFTEPTTTNIIQLNPSTISAAVASASADNSSPTTTADTSDNTNTHSLTSVSIRTSVSPVPPTRETHGSDVTVISTDSAVQSSTVTRGSDVTVIPTDSTVQPSMVTRSSDVTVISSVSAVQPSIVTHGPDITAIPTVSAVQPSTVTNGSDVAVISIVSAVPSNSITHYSDLTIMPTFSSASTSFEGASSTAKLSMSRHEPGQTTPPSQVPTIQTHSVCKCGCGVIFHKTKLVRDELLLSKRSLSVNVRKRISVSDSRPSAAVLGTLGTTLLILTIASLLIGDCISTIKYFCRLH